MGRNKFERTRIERGRRRWKVGIVKEFEGREGERWNFYLYSFFEKK